MPKLFTSIEDWITLDYCLLVYCLWMVYDLPDSKQSPVGWWEQVIIETDDLPRKAQRDPLLHSPNHEQLSLF